MDVVVGGAKVGHVDSGPVAGSQVGPLASSGAGGREREEIEKWS